MALSAATLKSGLESMEPSDVEATAISAFVQAWDGYFAGASVAGIPATAGSYAAGLSAMSGAMVGMSAPGAGAVSITAGITAFWGAIASAATAIWVTAPIILIPPIVPPVGLASLAGALSSVFAANAAGNLSLSDAAGAVANAIHASGGLGAMINGSVPPAPPVPIPIL